MKVLWMAATPCGSVRRFEGKTLAGGWLISLEDELKKEKGVELHVAYLSNKKEDDFYFDGVHYYPIFLYQSNNPLIRILQRRRSDLMLEKLIFPQLLKCIDSVKPDIIHVHGTEGIMGICAKVVNNIPIVFSIQGLIAPYKEKFFSGISQVYAFKLDSLSDRLRGVGIKDGYKSFCYRAEREKIYLKNAQYVFGRTFWDRDCTLALNPQRKYYVVNEILRPEFYVKQWKGFISKDRIKIISTISGGIYKGFETVLKTASLLKQYSHINFEWHIVGYAQNTKWVNISEKMTGIYSEENNIVFHGRIDAEKLSDLLCETDMYVHVSHIENSPNSVCEAMILGMPVIASYSGGTSSLLQHEKEGVLFQDGDPYVLSGAIVDLYQNSEKAIEYGQSARNRALYRHDKNRIVKEVISGYKDILEDFLNINRRTILI